jgi:hypothetical protein
MGTFPLLFANQELGHEQHKGAEAKKISAMMGL